MYNIVDWSKIKDRFNAFWQGEVIDRCCIAITAPRNKTTNPGIQCKVPKDLNEKWLDPGFRFNNFMYEIANTYYAGEAFPNFWINLGPGVISSFIGSQFVLGDSTVWFDHDPIIKEWDKMPEIGFNPRSDMWKIVCEMTEYFCKNAGNNYFASMTDLGGSLDIIASLRGTENLLFDLYDYPEEVKALTKTTDEIWLQCYDKLEKLAGKYLEGMCTWLPVWCKERMYTLQCDFSAMISPSQFEEFVVPTLVKQANFLDKAIYHLDGPGQIQHLDQILDIEKINGIEWIPLPKGAHSGVGSEQWYLLYKKIQEKGKNLILRGIDPCEIEKLLENISPEGLFLTTYCESEDEADELLEKMNKITFRVG